MTIHTRTIRPGELVSGEALRIAREIIAFEADVLPGDWDEGHDESFLVQSIMSPESIIVIARDDAAGDSLIGMMLIVPYDLVVDEMRLQDPLMTHKKEKFLYVETIAIHPGYRHNGLLPGIIQAGISGLHVVGIYQLSMHLREDNGFARFMTRYFVSHGFVINESRSVPKLEYAGNEPVLYLEVNFSG